MNPSDKIRAVIGQLDSVLGKTIGDDRFKGQDKEQMLYRLMNADALWGAIRSDLVDVSAFVSIMEKQMARKD